MRAACSSVIEGGGSAWTASCAASSIAAISAAVMADGGLIMSRFPSTGADANARVAERTGSRAERYPPRMKPVVEAALVGMGGSVIVAIVAFVTTWAVTRRTLNADRDRRLWEKESAAYELMLSELMRIQAVRQKLLRSDSVPDMATEFFDSRESPSWTQAEGMLLAYAPQAVHDALGESVAGYDVAAGCLFALRVAEFKAENDDPDKELAMGRVDLYSRKLKTALIAADQKDQALANAIRAQLGKRPVTPAFSTRLKISG